MKLSDLGLEIVKQHEPGLNETLVDLSGLKKVVSGNQTEWFKGKKLVARSYLKMFTVYDTAGKVLFERDALGTAYNVKEGRLYCGLNGGWTLNGNLVTVLKKKVTARKKKVTANGKTSPKA